MPSAEYQRLWRLRNPDKVKASKLRWRTKNRDKYNQQKRDRERNKYNNDPEYRAHIRAKNSASQKRNRPAKREYLRKWWAANPDKVRVYAHKWRRKNHGKVIAYAIDRKIAKDRATPNWIKAKEFAPFYAEAKRITEETGVPHHVDHIVPLRGKTVCGLHVPWNLRVIPAKENMAKHNRFLEAA